MAKAPAKRKAKDDDDGEMQQVGTALKIADRKNSPDDDAVIALNLGKMKRAKADYDSHNGTYRSVLKHVEAKGIHLKAAKRAIAINSSEDRTELVNELKALCEYLAILGAPIEKAQLDLFRSMEPRVPGIDRAAQEGRYAGIMGEGEASIPYAEESAQGQSWLKAFRGGQDERKLILAMEPESGSELKKGKKAEPPEPEVQGAQAGEMDAFGPIAEDEDEVHAEFDAGGAPAEAPNPDEPASKLH